VAVSELTFKKVPETPSPLQDPSLRLRPHVLKSMVPASWQYVLSGTGYNEEVTVTDLVVVLPWQLAAMLVPTTVYKFDPSAGTAVTVVPVFASRPFPVHEYESAVPVTVNVIVLPLGTEVLSTLKFTMGGATFGSAVIAMVTSPQEVNACSVPLPEKAASMVSDVVPVPLLVVIVPPVNCQN
jgi:hypothetical protein